MTGGEMHQTQVIHKPANQDREFHTPKATTRELLVEKYLQPKQ